MGEYLKMSDVFGDVFSQKLVGDAYEIASDTYGHVCVVSTEERSDVIAHAINSHDELVEINKYLMSKLEEVDKCFEAAYIDGLSDAFANDDISTVKDTYCRRIDFARRVAIEAISKEG